MEKKELTVALGNVRTCMGIDKMGGKVWATVPMNYLETVVEGASQHLNAEEAEPDEEEWGVFEFATGVLWSVNPPSKEEAEKCAASFADYGYHLAVPVVWGEHMRNAGAHGRARGLKQAGVWRGSGLTPGL